MAAIRLPTMQQQQQRQQQHQHPPHRNRRCAVTFHLVCCTPQDVEELMAPLHLSARMQRGIRRYYSEQWQPVQGEAGGGGARAQAQRHAA